MMQFEKEVLSEIKRAIYNFKRSEFNYLHRDVLLSKKQEKYAENCYLQAAVYLATFVSNVNWDINLEPVSTCPSATAH